ncbi:MAG: GNAT family N-acetyltransferase [Acidimicrobiales bacterium]
MNKIVTAVGLLGSGLVVISRAWVYWGRQAGETRLCPAMGAASLVPTDIRTSRLQLHAIDVEEGERIVARSAGPADAWADDFPFEGDFGAVGGFLRASAERGEQRPFGYYRVTRLADGRAVGGIGFKGQPDGGCVEIGYGLAPSARGHGYATEALVALLAMAAGHGLTRVIADTTPDNIASQRTLSRAGFRLVGTDDELHHYEGLLDTEHRPV